MTSPLADPIAEARERLAAHGTLRSQPASDWQRAIPLPPALATFYEQIGPVDVTIEGYGNPWFLPSLTRLWDLQAGYRWHGLTGERLPEWLDTWIVVADTGGDPYILDTDTSEILFAYHGAGSWEPGVCFSDLTTMTLCLATLGTIVLEAGEDFVDEDFRVRPEHRARAVAALTPILGSPDAAEDIVIHAAWG